MQRPKDQMELGALEDGGLSKWPEGSCGVKAEVLAERGGDLGLHHEGGRSLWRAVSRTGSSECPGEKVAGLKLQPPAVLLSDPTLAQTARTANVPSQEGAP